MTREEKLAIFIYDSVWTEEDEGVFVEKVKSAIKHFLDKENLWHKTSEELPPYDKVVIVAYDGYTEDCCFNHRSNNPEVKTSDNGWCDVGYDTEPTHWMEIPEIKED